MNWMGPTGLGMGCIEDRLKSKLRTRVKTDEDVISCLVESHKTVTLRFQRREDTTEYSYTKRRKLCGTV